MAHCTFRPTAGPERALPGLDWSETWPLSDGDPVPCVCLCVCVRRRSVIEAMYIKLNPHKEEEGVSGRSARFPSHPSSSHPPTSLHLLNTRQPEPRSLLRVLRELVNGDEGQVKWPLLNPETPVELWEFVHYTSWSSRPPTLKPLEIGTVQLDWNPLRWIPITFHCHWQWIDFSFLKQRFKCRCLLLVSGCRRGDNLFFFSFFFFFLPKYLLDQV